MKIKEREKASRALDYKHRKKIVHFTDSHKEALDVWRTERGKQMFFLGISQWNKNVSLGNKNILFCDHLRWSVVSRVQGSAIQQKKIEVHKNEWSQASIMYQVTKVILGAYKPVQWCNDGSSASGSIPGNGFWMAIPIRAAALLSNKVLSVFQYLNTPE